MTQAPTPDHLFLEREWAEELDINEDSPSEIRLALNSLLAKRFQSSASPATQRQRIPEPITSRAAVVTSREGSTCTRLIVVSLKPFRTEGSC